MSAAPSAGPSEADRRKIRALVWMRTKHHQVVD